MGVENLNEELINCARAARFAAIEDYFKSDANRLSAFLKQFGGILFDFSKSKLSENDLIGLLHLASAMGLEEKRAQMFGGGEVNLTENRAVLHMALRDSGRNWQAKGQDVSSTLKAEMVRASEFAKKIHSGIIRTNNGERFKSIVHIGIGGSDLGPRLVYEALKSSDNDFIEIRFCANIEPNELATAISGLDPKTTLIVCVSKTFTTIETLTNLNLARDWLKQGGIVDDTSHLVAISAAPAKAIAQGFAENRIFGFEDWVGGRFSLWSSVGLSLEMALGGDIIAALRAGAQAMDEHFETAPLAENIPILAGLIAVWNAKYMDYQTRASIPYSTKLKLLPQFLQQLDMESNGKSTGVDGAPINISGPIVWGAEGTNAQHAFFQHLHQSPIVTPIEFVLVANDGLNNAASTRLTHANALAQGEALMRGKSLDSVMSQMLAQGQSSLEISKTAPHRVFHGNRPSNTIILPKLDAFNLGALLAYYEHRCFVEGVIYGVNSFDQWGVELGKTIALEINDDLETGASSARDPSTKALIDFLREGFS
ncbi:MAG: glucose-6-phosphate isomerase [Hyphomonadaceae bacterium]|nr:MAG: glucose-6-phosphate isomerase [Hyphomonadaceae bacterium]KAF0184979.1 MAG: glucose-6-phosphate isomerase [Hyphomonadaceae bacterium]